LEKQFYFDRKPECTIWDNMWTSRTIDQELQACDIETPPRDFFLSYIPKDGKVIDAGCGFGKWVIYLHRLGYNILGIDNNDLAVSKLREFDPALQVEKGDILATGYPDHAFDAYISMGVVEHFEEGPQLALKEAYRILRPGGLIFVSVPTMNVVRTILRRPLRNLINRAAMLPAFLRQASRTSKPPQPVSPNAPAVPGGKARYCHFTEYRYSRSELQTFLKQAGFEVLETVPHDFYGSRDHAIGLGVDFPFLRHQSEPNFCLTWFGKLLSVALDGISPWVACASVLCVAKAVKSDGGGLPPL
jgi:SAM-dependent methyltransferase